MEETFKTQEDKRKRGRRTKEEMERVRMERSQRIRETFPICKAHSDCHAFQDGRCAALADTDFGGRDCPFYKNREENRKEQKDGLEHLIRTGRTDLIAKYKKPLGELGILEASDEYTVQAARELEQYSRDYLRGLLSCSSDGDVSAGGAIEEDDWDD
ncbi:MAG TPA: hypothetical protein IAA55_06745 [Candidatus Pullilachnospira gallistercoris]|uniref:Uncharacterized protein n=1 Tax=Candidatus Pullilachnospira gallistercoris TaxID=2840911 RepID=A0A9D1EAF1_9FIRM|nr:hypothetical protein [Candidatus Pullilachnospira gallistercoris]